ncbi:peptide ABC transporter substrate-binding protein, partial [Achromatium sp. WMS2]
PTSYLFKLRFPPEQRKFANGQVLTTEDIRATLASILDPSTGSPYRSQLTVITNIKVLDSEQLEITINKLDPIFPTRLVLGILPATAIASKHPFHNRPIGSGPFQIVAWPIPGRLRLIRNRDQHTLDFIEVRDPSVRVMKILRGEINILQNDLSPELFRFLRNHSQIHIQELASSNFTYLGIQMQDPDLSQIAIRQAIAHAIDRQAIIHYLLADSGQIAQSLLPPQHWAGATDLPQLLYDKNLALKLLSEHGYSPAHPLNLSYKTTTDPFRLRLATVIQAQLKEVGINIQIQSLDWGTFYGDIKNGRFQLYSLSWIGVKTPDHFRAILHSTSIPPKGANRGRYNNPEVDRLLDQAEQLPDLTSQAQVYKKLQHLLLQDLPYIPLWYENIISVTSNAIRDYQPALDGNFYSLSKAYNIHDK